MTMMAKSARVLAPTTTTTPVKRRRMMTTMRKPLAPYVLLCVHSCANFTLFNVPRTDHFQVREGFIVDEDEEIEERAERRREKRKQRDREREDEHLDEEDLELIGELNPSFQSASAGEVCSPHSLPPLILYLCTGAILTSIPAQVQTS